MQLEQYRTSTVIAACAAVLVVCSIPVFGTPFLNDTEFYALFADKLLSGATLYRDAMDVKPPLVFLHYAMVFKIFGLNNMTAIKIVTMCWLGLTALGIAALSRALSSTSVRSAAFAAFFFTIASFSGWGQDFLSSNTEVLANLFIVTGVYFIVANDFGRRPVWLIAGGAFIGISCLYRYQSGAALLAYLATILLRRREFDRKVTRLLLIGIGFALPFLVVVAYYARIGALEDLKLLLAYQAHYMRESEDLYWPHVLSRLVRTGVGLWPMLLLAVWQAAWIVRKRGAASREEIFQLMFASFSAITFILGARFYPHYFVQAIPALALLAAARLQTSSSFDSIRSARQLWFERHALQLMVSAVALFAVINGLYLWTRKDDAPKRDLVAFVEAHSEPNDQVLLWTWRPELLFQTGRNFATRQLVNGPLIGPPDGRRPWIRRSSVPGLWRFFLRDLASAPPKLIFDAPPGPSVWPIHRFPQLESFLRGYYPCQIIDEICVYLRK